MISRTCDPLQSTPTAITSGRLQTRAGESTAVPIQELIPECGHTAQRFFDLDKFGELREYARIIVLLAKARHRVGDVFFVPNPTTSLACLRAAIRDVHGSTDCRPARRHDLPEWCTATASLKLALSSTLVSVCWPHSRCVIKDHCSSSWWASSPQCLKSCFFFFAWS